MIAWPQHPGAVLFLLLPLLLFWSAGREQAATIEVDAGCSLFNAFVSANANSNTDVPGCEAGSGDDTIVLTASDQPYSHSGVITVTSGSVITVQGNDNTISGVNSHRIFEVIGSLTLDNLTLTAGQADEYGAIRVHHGGSLTISNSTVTNNTAVDPNEDDAIPANGGVIGAAVDGDLTITIRNSSFSGNTAEGSGSVMYIESDGGTKTIDISNSSFTNNGGSDSTDIVLQIGSVGPIAADFTISNSTFSGNAGTALLLTEGTDATITHITAAGNGGNGISTVKFGLAFPDPIVRLRNSLLADNAGGDCHGGQFLTENTGNVIADGSCNPRFSGDAGLAPLTQGARPYHELLAGSPALEAANPAYCNIVIDPRTGIPIDQTGAPRPQPAGSRCDIGAYESGVRAPQPPPRPKNGNGSGSSSSSQSPTATPTPYPQAHSGEWLLRQGYGLAASHGLRSGVQFRRLGAAGVGIDWVIDLGFLDALDVWGFVEQGVEVCFPPDRGYGGLMFLDAATSPRAVSALASVLREGYTCASINRPGTLVLVSNAPLPSQLPMPTSLPTTILRGCLVRTNYMLNFRDAPAGALLGQTIPFDVTLVALSRTAGWFQVDYHGLRGWISAGFVTPMGYCG